MPSIGSRCQRILKEAPRERRTIRNRIRNLPEFVVWKLWRALLLKVAQIFHFMEVYQNTVEWCGSSAVEMGSAPHSPQRIHNQAVHLRPKWDRALDVKGETFIFGEPLPRGEGKVDAAKYTHDPILCQHPHDKMAPRGKYWWTCKACGSRWERIPIANFEPKKGSSIHDNDLITWGKYTGHTYLYVWNQDKHWCSLALMMGEQEEASYLNTRFATYLAHKELEEGMKLSEYEIPAGRLDMEL